MLRPEANYYQYFFFGGILGEILELPFVGNYLKENKELLTEMGITDIGHKTLSSFRTADHNAQLVKDIINKQYKKSKKPLIIFCHSKGCLEVILAMKDNVEFFEQKVHRIFCVQPPFQGSAISTFFALKYICGAWPGLKCLNNMYYSQVLQEALVKNKVNHKFLKERVVVIRGYKSMTREVSWIIMPSHFILGRKGRSDGLVHFADQMIPEAQYRELILELDHADLFTNKRLSRKTKDFRKGLMSKLINWSLTHPVENDRFPEEIAEWVKLPHKKIKKKSRAIA